MKLYRVKKSDGKDEAWKIYLNFAKFLDTVVKETDDKKAKQYIFYIANTLMTAYNAMFRQHNETLARRALQEIDGIFNNAMKQDNKIARHSFRFHEFLSNYWRQF